MTTRTWLLQTAAAIAQQALESVGITP